jgi:hypothetical protein
MAKLKKPAVLFVALFVVFSLCSVNTAEAADELSIHVDCPILGENYPYQNLSVKYAVSYRSIWYLEEPISVNCFLDGQLYCQTNINETETGDADYYNSTLSNATGKFFIDHLSLGKHNLQINGTGSIGFMYFGITRSESFDSGVINFSIGEKPQPTINSSTAVIAGGAVAATVLAAAIVTVMHFKRKSVKAEKPT